MPLNIIKRAKRKKKTLFSTHELYMRSFERKSDTLNEIVLEVHREFKYELSNTRQKRPSDNVVNIIEHTHRPEIA